MAVVGNKRTPVVGNLRFKLVTGITNSDRTYRRRPCGDTGARASSRCSGGGLCGGNTARGRLCGTAGWWLGNRRGIAGGLTHVVTDVVPFTVGELDMISRLIKTAKTVSSGLDKRVSALLVTRELAKIRSQSSIDSER